MKKLNIKPGEVIIDFRFIHLMRETNVIPPYTKDELIQLSKHDVALVNFFSEYKLLKKSISVDCDTIKKLVLKESDLTQEGLLFFFNVYTKKGDMKNFWVDPEKRVKRVFVKALEKMRAENNG